MDRRSRSGAFLSRPARRQSLLLLAYLAAGVAATWPRATYLAGRLPATLDQSSYVWGFWWIAHQAAHLASPWHTTQMGAPIGVPLGFDTLMPLPGLVMAPVTLVFGPSVTYNLLAIVTPGLLCHVMYRAARLWLATEAGAIAAGAFYGLSSMLAWRDWYHLNIALGGLFLPMALEASARLRRRPGWRPAVALGAVLGAAFLVNQESSIMATALSGLVLIHWLARRRRPAPATAAAASGPDRDPPAERESSRPERGAWGRLALGSLAALVTVVLASLQLIPMLQLSASGIVRAAPHRLAGSDAAFGVPLLSLFSPSPRLADFGLGALTSTYHYVFPHEGVVTFGFTLTVLAVIGVAVGWRRRHIRLLAALWLGCSAMALGVSLVVAGHTYVPMARVWQGARMSDLMPYTWFVKLPGLTGFREADRFTLVGLVPAALLAGSAVEWLRRRSRLLLAAALVLAALEAGYAGDAARHTMPTALPAVDGPIRADHSHSVVVDIPFGLRGGVHPFGMEISRLALVLATADGHPRAVSYTSWTPTATVAAIRRHPFYRWLMAAQAGRPVAAAALPAARRDAVGMRVGWAIAWSQSPAAVSYLDQVGFRFSYRADGVAVYRLS